ncbi:methyltransferase domain-containing protein [Aestuariirhabdus sp. LZHN29]|uniref:methyltransferase domain-containing protein n=1 Tax=Aestuariirhabdus sp. LZHN29 TaxID=3417462 RepID=UPI003CEE9345
MDNKSPVPEKIGQYRDASRSEFWDVRIEEGVMPWDAGGVPRQLACWIDNVSSIGKVVIPGCGSGYEAVAFASAGAKVTAIDFSASALAVARENIGDAPVELRQEDVFTSSVAEVEADLVYERAFLAAIPERLRETYSRWVANQVRPGGLLLGYFLLGEGRGGPPFPILGEQLDQLLSPSFECIDRQPVTDSLEVFQGQECWQVWRRKMCAGREQNNAG